MAGPERKILVQNKLCPRSAVCVMLPERGVRSVCGGALWSGWGCIGPCEGLGVQEAVRGSGARWRTGARGGVGCTTGALGRTAAGRGAGSVCGAPWRAGLGCEADTDEGARGACGAARASRIPAVWRSAQHGGGASLAVISAVCARGRGAERSPPPPPPRRPETQLPARGEGSAPPPPSQPQRPRAAPPRSPAMGNAATAKKGNEIESGEQAASAGGARSPRPGPARPSAPAPAGHRPRGLAPAAPAPAPRRAAQAAPRSPARRPVARRPALLHAAPRRALSPAPASRRSLSPRPAAGQVLGPAGGRGRCAVPGPEQAVASLPARGSPAARRSPPLPRAAEQRVPAVPASPAAAPRERGGARLEPGLLAPASQLRDEVWGGAGSGGGGRGVVPRAPESLGGSHLPGAAPCERTGLWAPSLPPGPASAASSQRPAHLDPSPTHAGFVHCPGAAGLLQLQDGGLAWRG